MGGVFMIEGKDFGQALVRGTIQVRRRTETIKKDGGR
jgi:hypothetical protein